MQRKAPRWNSLLHTQASQAADVQPLDLLQINLEEAIRAHLVWMQVDLIFVKLLIFQEAVEHMDASPFSEVIQTTPVPKKFTILNFMLYSGVTNPVVNV